MSLDELIEQLELIKADRPEAANYDVRANDLDIFLVSIQREEFKEYSANYIELETSRPFGLGG